MTLHGSNDLGVLVIGGYDILGNSTDLSWEHMTKMVDTTPFGAADATYLGTGVKRGKVTQGGFYDDTANNTNDQALAALGAANVIVVALEGNTVGKPFIGAQGVISGAYKRLLKVDDLHRANSDYTVTGTVEDVHDSNVILLANATVSGTTANGTGEDHGASSAAGGSGYATCSALTLGGFTNLQLKVQHSTDNVTYVDLITFTALTTAIHAERITAAGTVNRWVRGQYTFTGAGSGQSAQVFIGFVRN